MTITTPVALVLLLTIPLIIYLGWPHNRFRRQRDSASLILRTVIVLLLVLALAGTQVVRSADRLAVVFLVDVSDSMATTAQESAFDYIREALPEMQPDDLAGIVAFGADAQVARSLSSTRELSPIRVTPQSGNTNLAAAIRLGLALFPDDTARRMVVLSDGLATVGNTDGAAELAAAARVEISYVPYIRDIGPEIQLQDVTVPTTLDEFQEFDLTMTITSETDTPAVVTVLSAGDIVNQQNVDLRQGTNSYTLRLQSGGSGFTDFQVQVEPSGDDGFYQNNSLGAFTRVEGAPRVLVVGTAEETTQIVLALTDSGIQVDRISPTDLPPSTTGLAPYESVVLVNVNATTLATQSMSVVESYVSDLGGGLVVVGGPNAYGPGGYFQTPLEDALPVEMRIRDQERMPQLTIAYVIDRSGSMGATGSSGVSNLDLAKEAIIRSVDLLQPTDRAGVVSFDNNSYWVAEFQNAFDRDGLQRRVATLRPGGGTSIMAGMRLVANTIVQEPSELKHIILLTDGGADPGGLVELSAELNRDEEVTTSIISIGSFPAEFMQRMADVGGGNYHNVVDPASIPTIFTLETVLATRSYIQEGEFAPTLSANHPIMQNIPALPSLEGYVAATPRTASQIILRGPEPFNDPVLAAWQYGLGRSVAFTSDATGRWAQNWVSWDQFGTFWSQAVRWTITEGASNNLETQVVMEDELARVIIDARDDDGGFLNGLDLQASVVHGNEAERVNLRQVAPGRYEATFLPQDEGAYLLRVTGGELNQTTGWVMSYSPEYQIREDDESVLETVAAMTDGQDLSQTPAAAFDHNIDAQNASVPLWPWLLAAAMILLPFDIAVRRLLITRSDLARLRTWLASRRRTAAPEDERISVLREARDRARTTRQPSTTIGSLRSHTAERRQQRETPVKPQDQPTTPSEEGNIGSRLLKRRRGQDEE
jgi:Mg-chelatase subunit ChlD